MSLRDAPRLRVKKGPLMHELDEITAAIIEASISVHRELGPGLLESVYEVVLARVLMKHGFKAQRQTPISFEFDEILFEDGFKLDLLVDEKVIVEIKSVERFAPVHARQLLTYLRLMELPVGLLINFGGATLREGLRRIVNKLPAAAPPSLRVNRL